MNRISIRSILSLALIFALSGCGYTQKTTLPRNIKTIYVDTVKNRMSIKDVYVYVPGLEMNITNAIIRRLQIDGNLKVVEKDQADAVLEMDLKDFQQEGLRFTTLEAVEEYRLYIVLSVVLRDGKTGEVLWKEPDFSGETEYFVSDIRAISREEASQRAVEDLARNVVDRIVEDW